MANDQSNPTYGEGRQYGSTPPPPERNEGIRSILSTIAVILIAPLLALVLTFFVFQSYQVDGPSMESTLHNNDRLIVWKMPKTWARISGHDYIPKRGDIVIFSDPEIAELGQDPGKQLIKRVIALPGERITVKNGVVTVYNDEHPQGFEPDKNLPYGSVIQDATPGDEDLTVPEGSIFVLGDNRQNSLDSPDFGPVKAKNIVGKLVLRVLPANQMKRF